MLPRGRWLVPLSPLVLIAPATAAAAELHVGSGQTYSTVQDAVSAAQAGDHILVHAGDYAGDVDATASGNANARIVLEPAGDGPATITGRITLDGDYWDVQDLTFVGPAGSDAFRVRGSYNRILGIELSGGDRDGIDGGGIGNEVRDSHIHHFDGGTADAHCIVLNPGAEDWVIAGNDIHDCSGDALQLYAAAPERSIVNVLVEGNHMYFTGALMRTENAIDVKNADGLVIRNNLMHGFPDNKVVVFQKGPANIEMSCNVMYDGFNGVEFRGEDGGVIENVMFNKNLMHDYSSYALKFDGTVGAEVLNNTFVDIANDGLRIEGAGLDTGRVHNNLWLRTGSVESGNFTASHNGYFDAPTDIASAEDVTADPLLDAMHRLGAGSPMIDAGLDVGLPFEGPAPDIGFHEVGLMGCEVPAAGTGGSGGSGAGGAGSGGGGGGGPSSGSGADGGAGADAPGQSDGGCGCRTAGGESHAGRLAWLLLALAPAARRRRTRGGAR